MVWALTQDKAGERWRKEKRKKERLHLWLVVQHQLWGDLVVWVQELDAMKNGTKRMSMFGGRNGQVPEKKERGYRTCSVLPLPSWKQEFNEVVSEVHFLTFAKKKVESSKVTFFRFLFLECGGGNSRGRREGKRKRKKNYKSGWFRFLACFLFQFVHVGLDSLSQWSFQVLLLLMFWIEEDKRG